MKAITVPQEKGELILCESTSALGRRAAEFVADTAEAAVCRSGAFTIALSGGSTPELMYRQLAASDLRDRVPWAQGEYFWSD